MGQETVTPANTASGPLLIAFAFSVAGWALLELWLIQIDAGVRAHCMAALFGLLLGCLSIRRPRIGLTDFPSDEVKANSGHRKLDRANIGWALLFLAVGIILGTLVLRGDTILLGIAAMSLALAPWSRVRFCCSHLLVACTAVWTGMLTVMIPGRSSIAPVFLPLACWVLWISTMTSLFLRIEQLSRADRAARTRSQDSPSAASANTSM